MFQAFKARLDERWRGRVTVGLLALAAAVLLAIPPFGGWLSFLSFDLLSLLSRSQRADDVVLLEMDEKSYLEEKQNYTQAWDRKLHAQLVMKLKQDGARAVIFDVVFFENVPPGDDAMLAQAMKAHGKVAIAMEYVSMSGTGIVGDQPRFPVDSIREAAAVMGMVQVNKDTDGVVRRHFQERERFKSLPWIAAELTGASLPTDPQSRLKPRWLNHSGSPGSAIPRLSYADAFSQAPGFFRDKVVFIGGAPKTKLPGNEVDTFRTPDSRWNGEETPGVQILAANYINLVQGNWWRAAPWFVRLLLILLAVSAPCACISPAPKVRWGITIGAWGLVLAVPCLTVLLFSVWFPFVHPALVLGIGFVAAGQMSKRDPAPAAAHLAGQELKPASVVTPPPAVMADPGGVTQVVTKVAPPTIPDHELIRCVGKGAYGEVWLAKNAIGSWHAVKITFRDRFRDSVPYDREFRGIQRFMPISRSHPGLVHLLHVGRNEAQGYFYCIMEAADDEKLGRLVQSETYAPRSLSSEIRACGRLPLKESIRVSLRLTEALGFLHEKNLIHRDIKPGNIIYVEDQPKLADVGLVTEVAEGEHKVSYLGTRGYIAPEGPGSPRADIFSLGKVIYEASMGLDCDQFPELPSTLVERPNEQAAPLIRLNQILLKACEPNPVERYQTAAQLRDELLALSKLL